MKRTRRGRLPYRKTRSIRQRYPDDESPRCKARRAHSPRKSDVPAVPVSPMAASSQELYDGRPAILPVSIRMPDLVVENFVASGDLPSVIAPPGDTASSSQKVLSGDGVLRASAVSMGDSEPAIMS